MQRCMHQVCTLVGSCSVCLVLKARHAVSIWAKNRSWSYFHFQFRIYCWMHSSYPFKSLIVYFAIRVITFQFSMLGISFGVVFMVPRSVGSNGQHGIQKQIIKTFHWRICSIYVHTSLRLHNASFIINFCDLATL